MFVALGKTIASARGFSSPALVVIPHPLGGLKADKVREKADNAVDLVVRALTVSGQEGGI